MEDFSNVYGLVITSIYDDVIVKLINEETFKWVKKDYNKKAKIDIIPYNVYKKIMEENKYMNKFKPNCNEMYIDNSYMETKAIVAPSIKEFKSVDDMKVFVSECNYNLIGLHIIQVKY